ncbi:MAG: two pore domain potassium channel family protein [Rhodospirillaceae bacterium]|mgnify:FL=1|jgi:hypothetical protein|nr:two pore domain potassium channel family protein [Rhodospirillaceae bacterium]MBT5459772.1 two pore domain potassium channel family protein [Rhodospirillaceae bacterium]MBT7770940.1 two pore domain potassium channel family protein [Rhodospirillales bacterium]
MLLQLIVGSGIISLTIVVTAIFLIAAIRILNHVGPWLSMPPSPYKIPVTLVAATLWLLGAFTASVWIWASAFVLLDLFDAFEPALYFSIVSFTTLGFGDITLPVDWRLLSGICAANGLLLFGLGAAFLVEVFTRLHQAQAGEEAQD